MKRPVGVCTGTKADGTPAIQMTETKYISEGNLYRLIIRSKLPAAEKFERWVFDEVLPELKRTGSYVGDVNLEEVIAKTATAVVSEVIKQIVPIINQTASVVSVTNIKKPNPEKNLIRKAKKYKHIQPSKIEILPSELKEKADEMLASGEFSCQQVANFIMNNCDMYISQMSVNRYKNTRFIVEDFDEQLSMF